MYKLEDLKFLNMDRDIIINKDRIFSIEIQMTNEDKIKFIDELRDGIATYLLDIINKWEVDKDSLSKDNYGDVKTVSKKAWLRKNDEREEIDNHYKIGTYHLFGTFHRGMSLVCSTTEYGYDMLYTDDYIVKQWFHDLCKELFNNEKAYFKSINPIDIKIGKVKEFVRNYQVYFDSKKINDIVWNGDRDIDEAELDIYIKAYERIEEYIETISKQVEDQVNDLKK